MPRGRGGARQGTPGVAYANRSDLAKDYKPVAGPATTPPPPQPQPNPAPAATPMTYPEDIPKPDDPTGRPQEPVTARPDNLMTSHLPPDPVMDDIRAAYALNPTPQLGVVLKLMMDRADR